MKVVVGKLEALAYFLKRKLYDKISKKGSSCNIIAKYCL